MDCLQMELRFWFSKIWWILLAMILWFGKVHIYHIFPSFFCATIKILASFLIGRLICAVTGTLLNFVRMFRKAHDENCKQAELEKKKVQKEVDMEKAKGINLTKKSGK